MTPEDNGHFILWRCTKGPQVYLEVLREMASVPQNYPAPGIER